ncbi:MAG: OmpA family protein [Flavobacteriales bacterium]|nr:OmpA family protein [Flavobacteriales bacterium]MBK7240606.1 OmpA family protein [Flavobacteriales bacterium]MBK7297286.1 OmpA family protein [Flavobacteriales bacterium]MBK9535956.1 OmpA family protein [Flavobacteriales bacterium]MBP9138868.1 OmpA family protein [Flavobacteriales bacterium]
MIAQPVLTMESVVERGNVIVSASIDDPEAPKPVFQGVWRGVPGALAVFQLQRTSAPRADVRVMLDRLVEAGLGAYLDAHLQFGRSGVTTDISVTEMTLEMNSMIAAAAEELQVSFPVVGLTVPTVTQLLHFASMDWSGNSSQTASGSSDDKYLAIYHTLKAQRTELDRQIRADLMELGSVLVWGEPNDTRGNVYRIASTCGTVFDEDNFLCALDLKLTDSDMAAVDPSIGLTALKAYVPKTQVAPEDTAEVVSYTGKIRKRDRWLKTELDMINSRLDDLDQRRELWQLRDRLEDIEDRIVGLELEVRDKIDPPQPEQENPLAKLSELAGKNLSVSFDRNSALLGQEHFVLLNEVFEQLARLPQDRVLITGYTDASGSPSVNLKLSELRAKAVRNYLLERGIHAERLMVNYYGDSRSMGRAPDERRVEIEWLAR